MHITTQRKLAESVGIGEVHLSNILSPKTKSGFSEDLANRLEKATGIKAITWATGRRQTVKRLLREFFYTQRLLSRRNSKGE